MGSTHTKWTKSISDEDVSRFVIDLNRRQTKEGLTRGHKLDSILSDPRRCVFISLIGLYRTYKQCPMVVLYQSLFILPIKSRWLESPSKYRTEINASVVGQCSLFQDPCELRQFLLLCKWKQSQGLLFCTLDDFPCGSNQQSVIDPFWLHLSERFVSLKLNSLETVWMQEPHHFKAKHNVNFINVLTELSVLSLKYDRVQEIIWQSNRNKLNAITAYALDTTHCDSKTEYVPCTMDGDKDSSIWWISADYDDDNE